MFLIWLNLKILVDFINYDNEKPENGGALSGNDFFAFDPLVSVSNAIF